VRIGLAGTVYDQQVSLQALGEVDWSRPAVAFRVHLGSLHIDFLEPRIVEVRLRLGRNGDSDVIDIGLAEHRVEGV